MALLPVDPSARMLALLAWPLGHLHLCMLLRARALRPADWPNGR